LGSVVEGSRTARYHRAWLATASVYVEDDQRHASAGLSISRNPNMRDALGLQRTYTNPQGIHRESVDTPPLALGLGTDVSFAVRWTANSVEVRLPPDPTWTSIPLSFAPRRVTLGCSTAEAIFHDVTVTSPTPAPTSPTPPPTETSAPTQ